MRIATHDGTFHPDDVTSSAVLRQLFPNETIIRTRDSRILNSCDIVFDVNNSKYDHHSCKKPLRECGRPYSSIGLIWYDFGKEFILSIYPNIEKNRLDYIWKKIDEKFIVIDCLDNNFSSECCDNIASFVFHFNPSEDKSEENIYRRFIEASDAVLLILKRYLEIVFYDYDEVEYLKEMYSWSSDKNIVVLDKYFSLQDVDVFNTYYLKDIKFVIYPSKGLWYLNCVKKSSKTFELKHSLPKKWAGLNGEELSQVCNVEGCVFCHPARFICSNKTYQGIIDMAKKALYQF